MKLIVGLGNPGEMYKGTRHNTGFLVLDALKTRMTKFQASNSKQFQNLNFKLHKRLDSEILQVGDVILAKPQTFMNRSGIAVKKLTTSYKLQTNNLYVVHDDLDIPLGKFKIQLGKGPRVHGGLRSIYEELGSEDFWHVRLGIENRFRETRSTNREIRNNVQILNARKHFQQTSKAMISGKEYVLQDFAGEEKAVIEGLIEQVVLELVGKLGGDKEHIQ